MYICTCSVLSLYYQYKTKHVFVYDSHFKPLDKPKCCGGIFDDIADVTIFVLLDNEKKSKK